MKILDSVNGDLHCTETCRFSFKQRIVNKICYSWNVKHSEASYIKLRAKRKKVDCKCDTPHEFYFVGEAVYDKYSR